LGLQQIDDVRTDEPSTPSDERPFFLRG